MKKLPLILPPYEIRWTDESTFTVVWEEMPGWGIVPRLGETLVWGMYDLPGRKLDVAYDMAVTGRARVHGLEGVTFTARVIEPRPELAEGDLMIGPVAASGAAQETWTFVGQLQDGYTRFLSAERMEDGVRTLTTFLDGDAFMANWGFGEDNRGNSIHPNPRGLIVRDGADYTAAKADALDVVGRCRLTMDGARALSELGVKLFGLEAQSVTGSNPPLEVHVETLSHEIILLEGITLDGVPAGEYTLFAAPLKLGGSEGAPCRALLITEDGEIPERK